ncbi:phosphoserine phosphatase SerB [Paucibacter sp. TC2R-5]|uniref:phosphoserine phosphatase SerB n=1 Tax=Paucibacter sp. TC2R-5 TaxID=2893555 RepID=UPI0021E390D5|nr:phosphoserine phosphatase SerB [Paucibacter sp. TC2R-5]MCV2357803.1 phosphoserine phosphatase SerB [Paucibacter sp. TC2R-5]
MTTTNLVLQGFTPPLALADFKLAAFDMDSTLISIECIDEIADAAGAKAAVAAITEAAMRGEITDFKDSLRRRLALLKGVPVTALDAVLKDRLQFNPGARELCAALKAAGVKLLLVSGGFTFFTSYVAAELGMDFVRSNELGIKDGLLTGDLVMQDWGDICDGEEKRRMMLQCAAEIGCSPEQCIAVGDGANDLLMMGAAGLSVAFHAKPRVREQAMVAINAGGLEQLLSLMTRN